MDLLTSPSSIVFKGQILTPDAWRDLALSLHQNGQLNEAESIYLKLLSFFPLGAEVHLLLGMLNAQRECVTQSLEFFGRAMVADPTNSAIQFNLGLLLEQQKQSNLALEAFNRALLINDKVALHWYNAALTYHQLGQIDLALFHLDETLRRDSSLSMAWSQKAIVLMGLGRFSDSKRCLEIAIALEPGSVSLILNLAQVFQELGENQSALSAYRLALMVSPLNPRAHFNFSLLNASMGFKDAVVLDLERALICDPAFASAWFNLGYIAKEQGGFIDAQIYVQRSLLIRPFHANSHNNLGVIFKEQGQLDLAIRCYDRSICIDPFSVQGLLNKANALQDLKQIESALALYDLVLILKPDHVDSHLSRSFALLQNGHFQEGWECYEWRWLDPKLSSPVLSTSRPPMEIGMRVERLLIWPEQGVGTEVMFCKFLNHVSSLAGSVTVQLDPRLVALLERTYPSLKFVSSEIQINESDFDAHLPLGSLGRWFGKDLQSISSNASQHLRVDEQRRAEIIRQYKESGEIWIGVNWKSKSLTTGKDRSLDLVTLIKSLNLTQVRFIDLQYGDTSEETQNLKAALGIDLFRIPGLDKFNDLDGLATLITCCNWVVSVDNSTAHLSSATGTPTLILLPFNADWRWLKSGTKTPWYDNTKLFRQKQMRVWEGALRELSKFLQQALQ